MPWRRWWPGSSSRGRPAARFSSIRRSTPYKTVSGVSGNLSSVGSDTLNNLMTLLGGDLPEASIRTCKIQIEGKGSSTAPPALIAGTAQLGPMSREMKGTEIDQFEKKYGYKPTPIRTSVDALAVFVNKDNPDQVPDARARSTRSSPSRAARGDKDDVTTWGQLGLTGDWASKPISLYGRNSASGHLRLLQGARAQERRLQGHREGAAGLGRGGAGRHGGPLRRRLQRHRLRDGRRASAVPLAEKDGGKCVEATADNAYSGELPAGALPLRLRQQGARQGPRSADARVRQADRVARKARKSSSRTATSRSRPRSRRKSWPRSSRWPINARALSAGGRAGIAGPPARPSAGRGRRGASSSTGGRPGSWWSAASSSSPASSPSSS